MYAGGFFDLTEFNAEGLHISVDFLQVDGLGLNYGLQKHAHESHHSVLIDFSVIAIPALVHAILEEYLDELLWQLHLPG